MVIKLVTHITLGYNNIKRPRIKEYFKTPEGFLGIII